MSTFEVMFQVEGTPGTNTWKQAVHDKALQAVAWDGEWQPWNIPAVQLVVHFVVAEGNNRPLEDMIKGVVAGITDVLIQPGVRIDRMLLSKSVGDMLGARVRVEPL